MPERNEEYNAILSQALLRVYALFNSHVEARIAVAATIDACAGSLITAQHIESVFDFLITRGLRDDNEPVLDAMVGAGVSVVTTQGKVYRDLLVDLLQNFLNKAPRYFCTH